jgi:cobalt-zinc-cadmium efflux system protein
MTTQGNLSPRIISKLKVVLSLTLTYLIIQIIGGLSINSLALIADAGHMLIDVGGLTLVLFTVSYTRKPATPQRTYGFYRMEILSSLANSILLILISIYIFYESYRRIMEPAQIQSFIMLIVATLGLAVNLVGILLLRGQSHVHHYDSNKKDENLNVKGLYLELLSDGLGSTGVIGAAIIIITTKFYLADPIISIGLALFIIPRTWSLMKKSIHILMEGVPASISHEEVRKSILNIKGVTGLFDLHIWTITSGINALSAHVVIIDQSKSQAILHEINSLLEKKFEITHATIQIESYHSESDTF